MNFFTGKQIVPTRLQKASPEMQFQPYTSGSVRIISKLFNGSPIKTEAWLRGTFGGVSGQALHMSDRTLAKLGLIPEDQIGGETFIEGIARRFTKARGGGMSEQEAEELRGLIMKQTDKSLLARIKAQYLIDLAKEDRQKARSIFDDLPNTEKVVVGRSIKSLKEAELLGLTYKERLIKQLQVTNGARARYIYKESLKMSKEERRTWGDELIRKKIMTRKVSRQVAILKSRDIIK